MNKQQTRTLYGIRIEFKNLTEQELKYILSAEDWLDNLGDKIDFDKYYDFKTKTRWWWIKTTDEVKVKEEID